MCNTKLMKDLEKNSTSQPQKLNSIEELDNFALAS